MHICPLGGAVILPYAAWLRENDTSKSASLALVFHLVTNSLVTEVLQVLVWVVGIICLLTNSLVIWWRIKEHKVDLIINTINIIIVIFTTTIIATVTTVTISSSLQRKSNIV